MTHTPLAVAAALVLSVPLASHAIVYQFNATLTTGAELHVVNGSSASGLATLFYDDNSTMMLEDDTYSFTMSVSDLTGASGGRAAQAFHIHGAATTTESATVRVSLDAAPFLALNEGTSLLVGGNGVSAPVSFSATAASATNAGYPSMSFLAMLRGSLAYVNVHTALNPAGEARGQLFQVAQIPEPSTYAMLLGGLGIVGFVARRRRAVRA